MSKSNRTAKARQQIDMQMLNILSSIERHLAVLAEPTRRHLQSEHEAQMAEAAQGEEE